MKTYVYFISCVKDGGNVPPIKIGVSGSPKKRLEQLSVASPYPLEIVYLLPFDSFPEAAQAEKEIQEALKERKTNGEWFYLCPKLVKEDIERFLEDEVNDYDFLGEMIYCSHDYSYITAICGDRPMPPDWDVY